MAHRILALVGERIGKRWMARVGPGRKKEPDRNLRVTREEFSSRVDVLHNPRLHATIGTCRPECTCRLTFGRMLRSHSKGGKDLKVVRQGSPVTRQCEWRALHRAPTRQPAAALGP